MVQRFTSASSPSNFKYHDNCIGNQLKVITIKKSGNGVFNIKKICKEWLGN